MNAKLTLRLNDGLVRQAKNVAHQRGKSVSGMVAEFFDSIDRRPSPKEVLPPVTRSLVGVLKGRAISEQDYERHLRKKYL
jgi:hypothetical protein